MVCEKNPALISTEKNNLKKSLPVPPPQITKWLLSNLNSTNCYIVCARYVYCVDCYNMYNIYTLHYTMTILMCTTVSCLNSSTEEMTAICHWPFCGIASGTIYFHHQYCYSPPPQSALVLALLMDYLQTFTSPTALHSDFNF